MYVNFAVCPWQKQKKLNYDQQVYESYNYYSIEKNLERTVDYCIYVLKNIIKSTAERLKVSIYILYLTHILAHATHTTFICSDMACR